MILCSIIQILTYLFNELAKFFSIGNYKWQTFLVLPQMGVFASMSQIRIDGSSWPPAEATKRSLGEIPIAATDAWWSKWLPTLVLLLVLQTMTCTWNQLTNLSLLLVPFCLVYQKKYEPLIFVPPMFLLKSVVFGVKIFVQQTAHSISRI